MEKKLLRNYLSCLALFCTVIINAQQFTFDTEVGDIGTPGSTPTASTSYKATSTDASNVVKNGILVITTIVDQGLARIRISESAKDINSTNSFLKIVYKAQSTLGFHKFRINMDHTDGTTTESTGNINTANNLIVSDGNWQTVYIDLATLGGTNWSGVGRVDLYLNGSTSHASTEFEIDEIEFTDTNPTASVKNNTLEGVSSYPNPVRNQLNVKTLDGGTISLFNILGAKVLSTKTPSKNYPLNVANLSSGIYVLKVVSEGKSFTQKVIKQ